jgi:hypothetical protein
MHDAIRQQRDNAGADKCAEEDAEHRPAVKCGTASVRSSAAKNERVPSGAEIG